MRHILSVLMENEPGALSRVVGLFSQRGYNIDTLNVAPTDDLTLSRLTLTTHGSDQVIEQITKHLNKLIDVIKVVDLIEGSHIERELMLVKVKANEAQRAEINHCIDIFRGQVVDVNVNAYTLQLVGSSDKLDAFLEAINYADILELVRSGVSGLARGEKILKV
ncbi:MAG: acetolactate synthase small subunit [Porticoccus sp.]|jgi:acetolactate synthase-1/3 small subunit|uniref:acetolactate synthase small subunit n=1 Tax=Porticoccus sp. Uisw_050_02 TaxID=3230978 RepID=UPI001D7ED041|nr:acetolactate synthase small subunit [Porticoccus sp.]|tara:strand:+ start:3034 stop:3525 length:492 start_codon:yes stop_codon:yes gene_type:complete